MKTEKTEKLFFGTLYKAHMQSIMKPDTWLVVLSVEGKKNFNLLIGFGTWN